MDDPNKDDPLSMALLKLLRADHQFRCFKSLLTGCNTSIREMHDIKHFNWLKAVCNNGVVLGSNLICPRHRMHRRVIISHWLLVIYGTWMAVLPHIHWTDIPDCTPSLKVFGHSAMQQLKFYLQCCWRRDPVISVVLGGTVPIRSRSYDWRHSPCYGQRVLLHRARS